MVALFFAVEDRRGDPLRQDMPDAEVVALNWAMLNFYEGAGVEVQRALRENTSAALKFDLAQEHGVDPWAEAKPFFKAPFHGPSFGSRSNVTGPILAIKPLEVDLRVMVQKSRFTIHGRAEPLNQHPLASLMLHSIPISGLMRAHIVKELQHLGYTRMALFPDLGNLGEDLGRFGWRIDR